MKNYEKNNVFALIKFELKKRKKTIFWWCIGIFAVMALYMLLFPMMQDFSVDMISGMGDYLEAFGMSDFSEMQNYNLYFAMEFQFVLVVICGYAVFISANSIGDEEKSGSIEFLNACRISRSEIFFAKMIAIFIDVLAVIVTAYIATLLFGLCVAADHLSVWGITKAYFAIIVCVTFFLALGYFFAGLKLKKTRPSSLGFIVLIITYLIGYLSALGLNSLAFTKWLSPIHLLSLSEIVKTSVAGGSFNVLKVLYVMAFVFAFVIAGWHNYKNKDL